MIQILVILKVKNFTAFEEFEQKAASIMKKYQGRIITAFETSRAQDNTGEEVHLLEFPNRESFDLYRKDNSLTALATLREKAILATEVKPSQRLKYYSQGLPM